MKKLPLALIPLVWMGCGADAPPVLRLVDVFQPEHVEGAPVSADSPPQALWDFSAPAEGVPELVEG